MMFRKFSSHKNADETTKVTNLESDNPTYEADVMRPFSVTALTEPHWFSTRVGHFLDKMTNRLMDEPCLGVLVRLEGSNSWEFPSPGSTLGGVVLRLPRTFYQKRLAIPAWLMFESSPTILAETTVDALGNLVVNLDTSQVITSLAHYQKMMKEPSIPVLAAMMKAHKAVCVEVRVEGDTAKVPGALRGGITMEAKLCFWYRTTMASWDYE